MHLRVAMTVTLKTRMDAQRSVKLRMDGNVRLLRTDRDVCRLVETLKLMKMKSAIIDCLHLKEKFV